MLQRQGQGLCLHAERSQCTALFLLKRPSKDGGAHARHPSDSVPVSAVSFYGGEHVPKCAIWAQSLDSDRVVELEQC